MRTLADIGPWRALALWCLMRRWAMSMREMAMVGWTLILIGIIARDRTQIRGGWQIVKEAMVKE